MEKIIIVESNHLGHFTFLPKILGSELIDKNGLTIVNSKLGSSMFNIVYGSLLCDENNMNQTLKNIIDIYQSQPFAWWIPHTEYNSVFTKFLLQNGFTNEVVEHAMICDLQKIVLPAKKTNLNIKPVIDRKGLMDFISVLEIYDQAARAFFTKLTDAQLMEKERLFVGYIDDKPVAIATLFISDDSAAIFNLITLQNAQRKGYGSDMMSYLLQFANENSIKNVTLSATSDVSQDSGYRIYERIGFEKIGQFECFEYAGK